MAILYSSSLATPFVHVKFGGMKTIAMSDPAPSLREVSNFFMYRKQRDMYTDSFSLL